METTPSTWNFGPNWPTPFKNADFRSIFASSAAAVTSSEKSSIITKSKVYYGLSNKPKMNSIRCHTLQRSLSAIAELLVFYLSPDFRNKQPDRELRPFCTLCQSITSIALISREEQRAQRSVRKWKKKTKDRQTDRQKQYSIRSNNRVSASPTQREQWECDDDRYYQCRKRHRRRPRS